MRHEIVEWFAAVCDKDAPDRWTAKLWAERSKVAPSTITRLLNHPHNQKKAPTPKPSTLAKLAAANPPVPAPESWGLPLNCDENELTGSSADGDKHPIIDGVADYRLTQDTEGSPGKMRDRLISQIVEMLPHMSTDVLTTLHGFMTAAPKTAPFGERAARRRPS